MIVGVEMLDEAARGKTPFDFLFFATPGNGKTDNDAAEHPQDQRGVGVSDPGTILVEGMVEAIMELAFDMPSGSLHYAIVTSCSRVTS